MPDGGSTAGWEFEVRSSDSSLIGTFATGEDGTVLTDYLLPGEYTVKEIRPEGSPYTCDAPRTLTLRRDDASTVLSKRLGDLLELFLRNPGQTLPRETILLRVWGMDCDVDDGNLDNYTYFLRRSLRKVGSRLQLATVRGAGYRLEARHG